MVNLHAINYKSTSLKNMGRKFPENAKSNQMFRCASARICERASVSTRILVATYWTQSDERTWYRAALGWDTNLMVVRHQSRPSRLTKTVPRLWFWCVSCAGLPVTVGRSAPPCTAPGSVTRWSWSAADPGRASYDPRSRRLTSRDV